MHVFNVKLFIILGLILSISACSFTDGDGDGTDTIQGTDASSDGGPDADADTNGADSGDSDFDSASSASVTDLLDSDTVDTAAADTASDTVELDTTGCGNGVIESPEVCDDGNIASLDGCAAMCNAVDDGYICAVPGEPCVYTIVCGDGQISGTESCDDFNVASDDGCSADCQLEAGWVCPVVGENCEAAACGDGVIAGKEECDDGNAVAADGCSDLCRLEEGWACDAAGVECHQTVCNDGKREGKELCDDGNLEIGDGCTPFCEIEPNCDGGGPCRSTCGDGFILPADAEECDDGNLQNNDGCSAACKKEPGFECVDLEDELPDVLEVPIIYRDFIGIPAGDGVKHPDFQAYSGSDATYGLVADVLGADGNPVYTGICERGRDTEQLQRSADTDDTDSTSDASDTSEWADIDAANCPYGDQTTSEAAFNQWYSNDTDTEFPVSKTVVRTLDLGREGETTTYFFESAEFFPLDTETNTWVAAELENASAGHNFSFTSELRYWFRYVGGESLEFRGDDDVWVFINNQLVVDIGGLHPSQVREIILDETVAQELALEVGQIYEIVLFHAERHTGYSRYNLTLSGFTKIQSLCETTCGDGIVAGEETCDDGINDGSYGSCMPDCTRGPRCGDGVLQPDHESCDDGVNLSVYATGGESGCAPGCVPGAYCGDGVLNSVFGEQCDDGVNAGGYAQCQPGCVMGPRCGDGEVQSEYGEQCDDGNVVSGDGCSLDCRETVILVE